MIDLLENEEWRDIPGWEYYRVSNMGRMLRKGGTPLCQHDRLIKPTLLSNGYLMIRLSMAKQRNLIALHKLVLVAFRGPPPTSVHQGGHGDGNKKNCCLDNLRWVTPKENSADKAIHGTVMWGEKNPKSHISIKKKRIAIEMRKTGAKLNEIAEAIGCHEGHASKIVRGKSSAPLL